MPSDWEGHNRRPLLAEVVKGRECRAACRNATERNTKMKKSIIALTAAVVLASSGAAFAKTVTSTVKIVDKSGDSITLSDGKKFTLPEGIEAETVKVGEKVTVNYSAKAGKLIVSTIRKAK
jgi:hypothetical protein